MSVFTLPVPWTDVNEIGLNGVVEVHSSELHRQKLEGSRVCELMALVDQKLQALPQHGNCIRTAHSIFLHGSRVSDDRLLESLIPDLESSAPRLVVAVQARPNITKVKRQVVFVKTLTGKSVTIACTPQDTVDYIKTRIRDKAHVPVDDQSIMYGGKQLQDQRKLSDYKIQNGSLLHLIARLRGGFSGIPTASRSFVDVSDGSKLIEREFFSTAPEWRRCTKGLNVEGICENDDCVACGETVIHPMGFEYFNLTMENDVQCPECHNEVEPITCGFYDCAWKFEGIKASDSFSISSRWKEVKGDKYHRFDEWCNSVDWSSLLLVAKPLQESTAAKLTMMTSAQKNVSRNDVCTVCWSKFGSRFGRTTIKSSCGHSFHRTCVKVWTGWCEKKDTLPSCPICYLTVCS